MKCGDLVCVAIFYTALGVVVIASIMSPWALLGGLGGFASAFMVGVWRKMQ